MGKIIIQPDTDNINWPAWLDDLHRLIEAQGPLPEDPEASIPDKINIRPRFYFNDASSTKEIEDYLSTPSHPELRGLVPVGGQVFNYTIQKIYQLLVETKKKNKLAMLLRCCYTMWFGPRPEPTVHLIDNEFRKRFDTRNLAKKIRVHTEETQEAEDIRFSSLDELLLNFRYQYYTKDGIPMPTPDEIQYIMKYKFKQAPAAKAYKDVYHLPDFADVQEAIMKETIAEILCEYAELLYMKVSDHIVMPVIIHTYHSNGPDKYAATCPCIYDTEYETYFNEVALRQENYKQR